MVYSFEYDYSSSANILALGSSSDRHNKAEILRIPQETWHTISPYPFSEYIHHYAILFIQDSFYIFGGTDHDENLNEIARLDAVRNMF